LAAAAAAARRFSARNRSCGQRISSVQCKERGSEYEEAPPWSVRLVMWTKDKLQKQLAFMREENWKISGTNAWKFGQESGIYLPSKYKEFGGNYGQVLEQLFGTDYPVRITHKHMLCMNHLLTSSVMFHRSIIENIGYFRHIQGGVEDYDYWLTISIWYDIGYLYEPMVMYRTGNTISYQKTQWVTQYFTYNIGRLLKWPDPVNVYPDEILDLSK